MEGYLDFAVPGHDKPCKTWYKVFGDLKSTVRRPLVVVHGGPGAVHDYLLPLTDLTASHGIPTVFYDQIGNGKSTHLPDKRGDASFWMEELFLAELRQLLAHLGVQGNFDLLGHSWGGMLAARHATSRPPGLKRLIIANAPASMELWAEAANRLRAWLPADVQAVLDRHEGDGTTETKEYQDAVGVFYARHLCRLTLPPQEVARVFEALQGDPSVYTTTLGPSEFTITASLRDWSVLGEIHAIDVPTLLLNGAHDEAQDSVVASFFHAIRKVRWFTFAASSHMPQFEEREKYMRVVGGFVDED